jgi:hypothetical protein
MRVFPLLLLCGVIIIVLTHQSLQLLLLLLPLR